MTHAGYTNYKLLKKKEGNALFTGTTYHASPGSCVAIPSTTCTGH